MKKRRIIGAAAVLAALLLVWSCVSRTPETLPMVTPEKSVADGLPGDGSGTADSDSKAPDLSAGETPSQSGSEETAGEQTTEKEGSDTGERETPAVSPTEEERRPAEPEKSGPADETYTCTISISCAAILEHMDQLDPEKAELVPEDGWILKPTAVVFDEGESAFQVLRRVCRQEKIHMEFANTAVYDSAYIEGIQNLYELDCGEGSGWMYQVNGWFPNYGCGRYQLRDGDTLCWVYTCDMGADVGGGDTAAGGQQGQP